MKFTNPVNGYTEKLGWPGLWTLIFGSFYFAVKGIWSHALISLILAICTIGISWLIYPMLATRDRRPPL